MNQWAGQGPAGKAAWVTAQAGRGATAGERPREGRDGLEWAHVAQETGLSTKCQTNSK